MQRQEVSNHTAEIRQPDNSPKQGDSPKAALSAEAWTYGIVPPDLMAELANRNPSNPAFQHCIDAMTAVSKVPFVPHLQIDEDHDSHREVYDAKGKEVHPGTLVRAEGDPAVFGANDANKAYELTGKVRDFYKQVFNRDSVDGDGMPLISTVNYGKNFQNAFWNGSQMTYGHPDETSPFKSFIQLDVIGHEITHGVTENEANETYFGQSGALNESISNVFGELITQWDKHQTADQASWVVGEGIWKDSVHGRGLRDMLHPGTAFDDPKVGKDKQPASMEDYVKTTKDNGGVHTNSGIPNRAFAEFATAVGGNAWEEPGHIWFEARREAGSNPSFASFAFQTIEAAKKLGSSDESIEKLKASWEDVGVTPSRNGRDNLTPPRIRDNNHGRGRGENSPEDQEATKAA